MKYLEGAFTTQSVQRRAAEGPSRVSNLISVGLLVDNSICASCRKPPSSREQKKVDFSLSRCFFLFFVVLMFLISVLQLSHRMYCKFLVMALTLIPAIIIIDLPCVICHKTDLSPSIIYFHYKHTAGHHLPPQMPPESYCVNVLNAGWKCEELEAALL